MISRFNSRFALGRSSSVERVESSTRLTRRASHFYVKFTVGRFDSIVSDFLRGFLSLLIITGEYDMSLPLSFSKLSVLLFQRTDVQSEAFSIVARSHRLYRSHRRGNVLYEYTF